MYTLEYSQIHLDFFGLLLYDSNIDKIIREKKKKIVSIKTDLETVLQIKRKSLLLQTSFSHTVKLNKSAILAEPYLNLSCYFSTFIISDIGVNVKGKIQEGRKWSRNRIF